MRFKTLPTTSERVFVVRPNANDPEEWTELGELVVEARRQPFCVTGTDPRPAIHFVPRPGIDLDAYDLACLVALLTERELES